METESNKVRSAVNEDRFSSLPDELIHQILSCLDTKFVVQTSILSSRWKHIWKSMPWLDFSSREFHTLHAFSKFVIHVLSHRNHQVEVTSFKLYFNGAARQAFVRKIANYVLSHNDQEPTVSRCPIKNHEFPPCFFSSRTLEQLPISFHMFAPCVTPITPWDFPALTILSLFDTMLCGDGRESFEPFSKCVNLTNLILRRVVVHAKVFDIITPRVTKLTLIDCEHSQIANVIAPQLERLTVIDSSINYMKAPLRLSYLFYGGDQHPQWFKDCFQSLNEVSVSLCIYGKTKLYKEKAARETINMLQQLHRARCLTLNMDIVECISSFPDLISHHPSPFSNLISLTINSNLRDRLDAHKLKMTTEARNFLLENSPSATLIMDLPKPPPTKAMKAKLAREKRVKLIAEIQTRMEHMQTSLDQENIRYIERKQAEEEMKTALEYLMTELQILTDKRRMQNELGKTSQIEELSQIKLQIPAYFRGIADMCIQEYDKALTFYTKMTDIMSLMVALRKLTQQMAEMEACHSSQLEETGTLLTRLLLTSKDLLSYIKQKIEAFKKYKSDNISTFQDTSSSAVIPTPSSTVINPMPCIDSGLLKIVLAHQVDTNFMKLELSSLGLDLI